MKRWQLYFLIDREWVLGEEFSSESRKSAILKFRPIHYGEDQWKLRQVNR